MTKLMRYLSECPICSAAKQMKVVSAVGDGFTDERAVMCMACGMVFLNPRNAGITSYYETDGFSRDFRNEETPSPQSIKKNDDKFRTKWEAMKQYLPESGTLLDIGSGSGSFVMVSQERFESKGIEPSTGYAKFSSEIRGLDVKTGFFPDDLDDDDEQYDVVSIFHALEHVVSPYWVLLNCVRKLKPDGVFILEYPDISRAVLRERFIAETYFQQSHLYDFDLPSITTMLSIVGFNITHIFLEKAFPRDKNVLLLCKLDMTMKKIGFPGNEALQQKYEQLTMAVNHGSISASIQ